MNVVPPLKTILSILSVLLASFATLGAQTPTVWHIPSNSETGIPTTMREPLNPGASTVVTIYQGVWKGDGANQTGGTLFYRITNGSWQSVPLSFHSNSGSNQFWKGSFATSSQPGDQIEYYIATTFDNRTSPTFIHGSNLKTSSSAAAQSSPTLLTVADGIPTLTVNGINANYTTTKLFVDEVAGDAIPVSVLFSPGQANVVEVEVYTNLNRRDRADDDANGDGYDDGISGLDGSQLVAGDDNHYYKAYPMDGNGGTYSTTLVAEKTGAYRLTARWKVAGDPAWRWYTNSGSNRRDHAITISPVDARDLIIYEINVLNIEASGDSFETRSTIEDMHNAPGAPHNASNRWDLDYLLSLGANCLWFQPIHPPARDGREPFGGWNTGNLPYEPGSPYAVKNFFEVSPIFTKNFSGNPFSNADLINQANRDAAMQAWQDFVAAADERNVSIMLDAPFNHTGFDVELGQPGVELLQPDGQSWNRTDEIRNREARFFSNSSNYGNRASSSANIAAGPDRFDFGKWNDVKDVFFGRYDALVEVDSEPERSSYVNEGDWFDTTDTDWVSVDFVQNGTGKNVTRQVWKYFARYATHWLEKTRPTGQNRNSSTQAGLTTAQRYEWDDRGIDGLRCDFGQGLPPQAWEYMINVARERKWNFVMMSESLDGGAVTYRSNRHFDILNENIVFPLKSATTANDYRNIFETRRSSYGMGLVLINNVSHDEENYVDPWEALIRYSVAGTMDGVPMLFPGQELGISKTFGYNHYELNFGKQIPHFKRFNSMVPAWNDSDFGNDQLFPVYAGIGAARNFSPALRSSNRWFLNGQNGVSEVFAVAKYQEWGVSPTMQDVVLAFVNLDRNGTRNDTFTIPSPLAAGLGIKSNRRYNVKNIAAYQNPSIGMTGRRDAWLWPGGYTGSQLQSSGFAVTLYGVPTLASSTLPTAPAWNKQPFEAQYLKLYDVTALEMPGGAPTVSAYTLDGTTSFSWPAVVDPEGLVPVYRLVITRSDGVVQAIETTETSYAFTGIPSGVSATAVVSTLNPNDTNVESAVTTASPTTVSLTSVGDEDGDGMANAGEVVAGTNPFDATSILRITSVSSVPGGGYTVEWTTAPGKVYSVEYSSTLGASSWITLASGLTVGTYTDAVPRSGPRFYRVRVGP